jgi:hypothetical protein
MSFALFFKHFCLALKLHHQISNGRLGNGLMTLMIQKTSVEEFSIFALSGRIRGEDVTVLEQLIESVANNSKIVLDLKEVRLVDRDAVKFLARCELQGAKLENCPLYVREWIIGA